MRRLRKAIRQIKLVGDRPQEGADENDHCWKNWGHLEICLSLSIEVIACRKLPTVS